MKVKAEPARFHQGMELWDLQVLQETQGVPVVTLNCHALHSAATKSTPGVSITFLTRNLVWPQNHILWPGSLSQKLQWPRRGICKPSTVKASPTYFEGEEKNISQVNHKH